MLHAVRRRARPYFEDAPPAHDWHHVERVGALAEALIDRCAQPQSQTQTPSQSDVIDPQIVYLAVFLHDIGREREDRGEIDDHAIWGAGEAARILEAVGATGETIECVQHCVRAHRYSNAIEPETLEAKLVSDADNLDALGAVGIARVFAHGGALGQPMFDPGVPVADDESTAGQTQYNHLHKKILDLPERMYTDVGRELATARAQFVRDYLEQFDAEVGGDR
ncbi:HD domain-containing protein [Natronorubrum sp. JWXQ-INN-674]|uniref:HD domain-containing protein n=1 Tax=Natronorubrum halalkaliphilum TaxID=2691917 RepID=A0A6B0VMT7_9EURY|nr:HD domain-containing protein [Natronorubrum halalkaliphilum]MXV62890.1 HD domain-containing protein [Natronorubrum halalkaliphilum]